MKNTYKSVTDLSFNVLINEKRRRISFSPLTNGGSIYTTSDEKEIVEIEKNNMFGTMFTRFSSIDERNTEQESTLEGDDAPDGNEKRNPNEERDLEVIDEIDNLSDAKAFLREKGLEVKDLRSKASVLKEAALLGFSFPNIR